MGKIILTIFFITFGFQSVFSRDLCPKIKEGNELSRFAKQRNEMGLMMSSAMISTFKTGVEYGKGNLNKEKIKETAEIFARIIKIKLRELCHKNKSSGVDGDVQKFADIEIGEYGILYTESISLSDTGERTFYKEFSDARNPSGEVGTYMGEIRNGKAHGSGYLESQGGAWEYEGNWVEGERVGFGKLVGKDKSWYYVGGFAVGAGGYGIMHGEGILIEN